MSDLISASISRAVLDEIEIDAIDLDYVMVDSPIFIPEKKFPFKVDITIIVLCIEGEMSGSVNLQQFNVCAPGLFIVMPEQVLQIDEFSDDFTGCFTLMSKKFTDHLLIDSYERFPIFRSIFNDPWLPMSEEELIITLDYYRMFKRTAQFGNNQNRDDIMKHLTQAFFLEFNYKFQELPSTEELQKQELLSERFLELVSANFKENRSLDFYSEKLCLTSKHLSKVLKETSGQSANEWIKDFVVLEAKALLRSTDMTVQQISNALSFPSQSFFGKYFKRHVGVSPKEYRST
jgi:AraC-like DNA-binding protein